MLYQIKTADCPKDVSAESSSRVPWAGIFALALIIIVGASLLMLSGLSDPAIDPTTAIVFGT